MGGMQVGWGGGGLGTVEWGDECSAKWGEMGKDFYPNFLQPFQRNIDRKSCNDGSRELILVFHIPHRKRRPSPSALARSLESMVGVPS